MTASREVSGNSAHPTLPNLLRRYLEREATAHAGGLARAETRGDVVPFDAGPSQPVDPKIAWGAALEAARFYGKDCGKLIEETPPSWPALVAEGLPQSAVPMCLGNYPQLVSNLNLLMGQSDLAKLRPTSVEPGSTSSAALATLSAHDKDTYPYILLTAALWRLSGNVERAADFLRQHKGKVPPEGQPAWANEEAAVNWHRGRADEAAVAWRAQPETVPVLFNRGLAALFSDRPAEARPLFSNAVSQLPEDNSWYHLGSLYIALAEMRG